MAHKEEECFETLDNFICSGGISSQSAIFTIDNANAQVNGKAWNPETQSWSDDPKHLGTDWRSSCAKCHTTGFDPDTKKAISLGIACEDCHGPGAAHAATGDKTKITVSLSDDVCATCHGQQKHLENMGKVV